MPAFPPPVLLTSARGVCVCVCHRCMLLTNWGNRDTVNDPNHRDDLMSTENLWIKIVSQWAVILLYVWSLIAPLVLKDRDFS